MIKRLFAALAASVMITGCAFIAHADTESYDDSYLISEENYYNNTVPEESLMPRLVDAADILSESEENALLSKLDSISEAHGVDVCVLTINSLGDRSASLFAEDYYAYNGMGQGPDKDGFILLLSMEDRDYAFATHGKGIEIYTDYGWRDYMIPQIKPELADNKYYDAFNEYADISEKFIQEWEKGTPFDTNHKVKGKLSPIWILISLGGGALVALINCMSKKSQLMTVSMQHGAADYIRQDSFKVTNSRDTFLYRNVTREVIESSDRSSGGGGSSTHSHSSGSSFGGGSGKF